MNKVFKKIVTMLAAFVMVFSFGFILTACGGDDGDNVKTSKVMNLSLNPSIELVLDKDNKVVSVSANNDEGNFIIANATFTGLTADDAVELFLQVTKNSGYIVEGSVNIGEDELKIEISGESAAKLYETVKKAAADYLKDANINVNISFEKISKADLQNLVRECMPDVEWVTRLSEEQLLEKIKESRQETKDIFSEELKDLYYKTRAEEILQAKFNAVKDLLATSPVLNAFNFEILPDIDLSEVEGGTSLEKFTNYFESKIEEYTTKLSEYKAAYETQFLAAEGAYQKALNDYLVAKQALLEARIETPSIDLTSLEKAFEDAEDALYGDEDKQIKGAKETANEALELASSAIETAKEFVDGAVTAILTMLDKDFMQEKMAEVKENFYAEFSSNQNFKEEIEASKSFWDALKPSV